jgi:hypothetical protein
MPAPWLSEEDDMRYDEFRDQFQDALRDVGLFLQHIGNPMGFRGQATQPQNSTEPDFRVSELFSWLLSLSPMPELHDENGSADQKRTWPGFGLIAKPADIQHGM